MIKFVFRWAFRLVLLALVLAIGLLLLKDRIVRNITENRIRAQTGFDAKIGRLEFSLFAPRASLENVVIYNPNEYGGSVFLDIPELQFEYDRPALGLGQVHLRMLRLNVREFHIVESQQGRTNLLDLVGKTAPGILNLPATPNSKYSFRGVDVLNLSVGTVRYTNLRLPKRNQVTKLNLKDDLTYNLHAEQDVTAVLLKVLLRAGIPIYQEPKPVKSSPAPKKG